MLGAVMFGHEQMQAAIRAINELTAEAGAQSWNWQPPADDAALAEACGIPVRVVPGDARAFKVTTADDLLRAEQALAAGAPAEGEMVRPDDGRAGG